MNSGDEFNKVFCVNVHHQHLFHFSILDIELFEFLPSN